MATYYECLGVAPTASSAEVRRAFRAAARRAHPDVGGSARAFDDVRVAWETLGDPARRAAYDRWLLETHVLLEADEQPWRRPSTGLPSTRTTVVGPVLLSGLMLVGVLGSVGFLPAVGGAAYVLLTVLATVRRAGDEGAGATSARLLLAGGWLLAAGAALLAVLAPATDRSPTAPLLVAVCALVFAAAVTAATYVQTAGRARP